MTNTIFNIAARETGRLLKGRIYWFCIFLVPCISCLFFLTMMHEGLPTDLPIAVVDLDNTAASRNLSRQLNAFEGTQIVAQYNDFSQAQTEMQQGHIYGIFYIPRNFTQETVAGKRPVLSFYTNNTYLIAGSLLFKDMKTVATLATGAVVLQTGRARGQRDEQLIAAVQPIAIETHPVGNPWLNYSVYLSNIILLGILTLMIMCVTVYSIGIEVKEKTIGEWLPSGNASILPALAGKLIPQTILFFIAGIGIFFSLYIFMHFPVHHIVNMLGALLLFIVASQALGVFMIGCFPTLRLALSFACLFGMFAFSITGFTFPVDAMYPPLQALSHLFPLRHYFLIYVDQALNERSFACSLPHYAALLAFLAAPLITLHHLTWSLKNVPYKR
ncbi:MAG: ABC transporter permease [Prevotellaceae bacterium]|jgi:ABC-2 type transport system permease protein|nr:ABC transporter permease [Prevotellaceae bacterium]